MRLLAACAVALLLAGCASDPPEADGMDETNGSRTLAAGEVEEVNLHLVAGQEVEWDWTASAALHFNVHSHAAGQVTEHAVEHTAHHTGSFEAPADGVYSLLWENRGAEAVDLEYEVRTDGDIERQP